MNSTQKPHPVDVAMSEMALSARTPHPEEFESSYQMREAQPGECVNSTDITLRAPGHGQWTEEERVERAARKWSEIDADHGWANFDELPRHQREELLKCARAVLAAADAVPGPEVEWTGEPPTEPGFWFWRFVGDTDAHVVELEAGEEGYPFEFEGRPREWWPVPISEPPGTKGEGGR